MNDTRTPSRTRPRRRERRRAVLLLFAMPLFACAGSRPSNLGVDAGRLAPCPSSPNCVSSDTDEPSHRVEPLRLTGAPDDAWRVVGEVLAETPRTRVVTATGDYLHAECRSALFGFVDDLELHLRPDDSVIAVRSASRLGYSDMGVNRRRVEALRSALSERGVVRPSEATDE